jgi:hypothetical protein
MQSADGGEELRGPRAGYFWVFFGKIGLHLAAGGLYC